MTFCPGSEVEKKGQKVPPIFVCSWSEKAPDATSPLPFVPSGCVPAENSCFLWNQRAPKRQISCFPAEKLSRIGNRSPEDCHFGPFRGSPPTLPLPVRAPVERRRNRSLISLAELALFSPPKVGAPRAQAPRLHGPRREAGAVSVFRSPGVGLFAPSQRSHVLYLTSPFACSSST